MSFKGYESLIELGLDSISNIMPITAGGTISSVISNTPLHFNSVYVAPEVYHEVEKDIYINADEVAKEYRKFGQGYLVGNSWNTSYNKNARMIKYHVTAIARYIHKVSVNTVPKALVIEFTLKTKGESVNLISYSICCEGDEFKLMAGVTAAVTRALKKDFKFHSRNIDCKLISEIRKIIGETYLNSLQEK